ncbi:MAG: 3-deoxy-manno-octulosonate cytidylyltransferase [Opitutales bacterium]
MTGEIETAVIVPARLASQRFPRKLLASLRGRPLILWTAAAIKKAAPGLPLYFAVAEAELARALQDEGFQTVLTDPDLPSGTDRLAAANRQIGARKVLNVQADEPLVSENQIQVLRRLLEDSEAEMATLATPFESPEAFRNENNVKVVRGAEGQALYFSRAPIPYPRGNYERLDVAWLRSAGCLHHLGLYGYRAAFLEQFSGWPAGRLEQAERLEQLRALERGCRIAVGVVNERTVGVDTPEDLAAVEALLQ